MRMVQSTFPRLSRVATTGEPPLTFWHRRNFGRRKMVKERHARSRAYRYGITGSFLQIGRANLIYRPGIAARYPDRADREKVAYHLAHPSCKPGDISRRWVSGRGCWRANRRGNPGRDYRTGPGARARRQGHRQAWLARNHFERRGCPRSSRSGSSPCGKTCKLPFLTPAEPGSCHGDSNTSRSLVGRRFRVAGAQTAQQHPDIGRQSRILTRLTPRVALLIMQSRGRRPAHERAQPRAADSRVDRGGVRTHVKAKRPATGQVERPPVHAG